MSAASNFDWLYHALGYTLAAAGMLLLLWSIFWDRPRGRRRCPKCWYDMSGVPGLKCPECGRVCARERALFKARRRKIPALLGFACVPAALVGPVLPAIIRGDWQATPTFALMVMAEVQGWPEPGAWPARSVCQELCRRRSAMSSWSRDWVSQRMVKWSFQYRPVWPRAVPLAVRDGPSFWYGEQTRAMRLAARLSEAAKDEHPAWTPLGPRAFTRVNCQAAWWDDEYTVLGIPKPGARLTINFRVDPQGVSPGAGHDAAWTGTRSFPIRLVESVDQVIQPIQSSQVEQEIRDTFRIVDEGKCGQGVSVKLSGTARNQGIAVALRIEFRYNGTLVGEARGWDSGDPFASLSAGFHNPMDIVSTKWVPQTVNDHSWTVTVRGDPELALRDFEAKQYWAGSFTASLKTLLRISDAPSSGSAENVPSNDEGVFLDFPVKPK